jgi:LuxR family maltose regulon positive regulatory protein
MTMSFDLYDGFSAASDGSSFEISDAYVQATGRNDSMRDEFYLLRDKLQIPSVGDILKRTRIDSLLERSIEQFPATLISGRSGTGKTALAASFAARFEETAWYTAESADMDWSNFARYLAAAIANDVSRCSGVKTASPDGIPTQSEIAAFLLRCFTPKAAGSGRRSLLVLDDIHHIFDAEWFEDFLNLMLYSLPESVHVIMLCRGQPHSPLWRLRSKQMLNVIDERTISFTLDETKALFAERGLPVAKAAAAHEESFGRVSKLLTAQSSSH